MLNISSTLKRILGIKIPTTKCGHETKIKDKISAFGETCGLVVPVSNGKTSYCHSCLSKMTILCAWCQKPIFIGDPITLYSPKDVESFTVLKDFHAYSHEPLVLVGCLSWECGEYMDRAGFWYPDGVHRVLSPCELVLQNNSAVIINDIGNPDEQVITIPLRD